MLIRKALDGVVITGCDVTGCDITGGDVTGCDITGYDITSGDITGCDITGCDVTGGVITGGDIIGCDITGGVFTGIVFIFVVDVVDVVVFGDGILSGILVHVFNTVWLEIEECRDFGRRFFPLRFDILRSVHEYTRVTTYHPLFRGRGGERGLLPALAETGWNILIQHQQRAFRTVGKWERHAGSTVYNPVVVQWNEFGAIAEPLDSKSSG